MSNIYDRWKASGEYIPWAEVKREIIKDYGESFGINNFVETGTYLGETVKALKDSFETIFSIELNPNFVKIAQDKVKNAKNVCILEGDSSKILPYVILQLRSPAVFWLDAHYSGEDTARGDKDTPILDELAIIMQSNFKNVILIDDAREFGSDPAYPTLGELEAFIHNVNEDLCFIVEDDIIRIY